MSDDVRAAGSEPPPPPRPPTIDEQAIADAQRVEAITAAAWGVAGLCEVATVALQAWLATKAAPREPETPAAPEPWRCPVCGARMQPLPSDGSETAYGCARTHPPIIAPADAVESERAYNATFERR